jgi:hypothetical protein
MSDVPQGPGWWQASDDKWYPPPRPDMPGDEAPTEPAGTVPTSTITSGGYTQPPPTAPYGSPPGTPLPGTPVPGAHPSPYGIPPTPSAGGGDNRTPLFVALGVLGAAALVGLVLVLGNGDDGGQDPSTSTSTSVETTDSTEAPPDTDSPDDTSAPPADGEITVDESDFSISFDQLSEADALAYGFLATNTTDQVAIGPTASIAFVDAAGTVVGSHTQTIGVLLPGQTMGLGDSGVEFNGDVEEMEVTMSEPTSWESPDEYGELTATGLSTTINTDWGTPITTFTAESTYEQQIDYPSVYAVYRNSSGDIVGGASTTMTFAQPSGNTAGEVESFYTIDDVDVDRTEVYIDPGYLG